MPPLDPQITQKLKKTGLSDKEAVVYSALIQVGGAYPSTLAEITGLNRTTIYALLNSLAIKGLVSEIQKRKKIFFQAEHPRNVTRYSQTRITMAKREFEAAQDALPLLEGLFKQADNKPIVRFFEGREGVLQIFQDHITEAEPYEMLAFSNTADLLHFLTEDFRTSYIKQKKKIGITTRAILPDTESDIQYSEVVYAGYPKAIRPTIKNISRTVFPYEADVTIYGKNKISIMNFSHGQLAGTIIEDKTIHDMMTMIFELAWAGVPTKLAP